MLGGGLSIPERAVQGKALRQRLGSALLGWWDAERVDLLTLAGGGVAAWADVVGGHAPAQGVAEAWPSWSANAFGGRPAVVFDGVDDLLTLEAQPFPAGTDAGELWLVASEAGGVDDPLNRIAFSYGGTGPGSLRGVQRAIEGGVVRARGLTGGMVAAEPAVAFSGAHVLRVRTTASGVSISVDGGAFTTETAYATATGTSRVRIGGNTQNANNPWRGAINAILVTAPLSAAQGVDVLNWCLVRAGRG